MVSPFYPKSFPKMPQILGVELSTTKVPIKNWNKDDLLLVKFIEGTSVAGVFTKSYFSSSNVDYCRSILPYGTARILVVNSGNANVATGQHGVESVQDIVRLCSQQFLCSEKEVYFSSTGNIGEILPTENIKSAILKSTNNFFTNHWHQAAIAITTTDTYPKMVTKVTHIDGKKITINGICKGAGMIAPNMATTLAYIMTDACISSEVLQSLLNKYVEISFNSITVDNDTSTSDTCLIFATNQAGHEKITTEDDIRLKDFAITFKDTLIEMSHLVVKDGEGISKFITINIKGATSTKIAKKFAFSIANSQLVKTSIAGSIANWGRIIMALGKAGEPFDKNKVDIEFCGEKIVNNGFFYPDCNMSTITEKMQKKDIIINVNLKSGESNATVWTCDLNHDYITINSGI